MPEGDILGWPILLPYASSFPFFFLLITKTQPLCTGAESSLRHGVLSKVEKNRFIVLPGEVEHSWFMLPKLFPNRGGFGEESYSSDSRVRLLIRIGVCAGSALF